MTRQQAALLAKARESLSIARVIYERGSYGFAAARAYYAMFYVAEALLMDEGLRENRDTTGFRGETGSVPIFSVIAAFGEKLQKTGRVPPGFHRMLIDAEECREVGDYEISANVSPELASDQVSNARRFLDLAEKMLGPLPAAPE
jgi:uncharacterized protein (UPF0332 family)